MNCVFAKLGCSFRTHSQQDLNNHLDICQFRIVLCKVSVQQILQAQEEGEISELSKLIDEKVWSQYFDVLQRIALKSKSISRKEFLKIQEYIENYLAKSRVNELAAAPAAVGNAYPSAIASQPQKVPLADNEQANFGVSAEIKLPQPEQRISEPNELQMQPLPLTKAEYAAESSVIEGVSTDSAAGATVNPTTDEAATEPGSYRERILAAFDNIGASPPRRVKITTQQSEAPAQSLAPPLAVFREPRTGVDPAAMDSERPQDPAPQKPLSDDQLEKGKSVVKVFLDESESAAKSLRTTELLKESDLLVSSTANDELQRQINTLVIENERLKSVAERMHREQQENLRLKAQIRQLEDQMSVQQGEINLLQQQLQSNESNYSIAKLQRQIAQYEEDIADLVQQNEHLLYTENLASNRRENLNNYIRYIDEKVKGLNNQHQYQIAVVEQQIQLITQQNQEYSAEEVDIVKKIQNVYLNFEEFLDESATYAMMRLRVEKLGFEYGENKTVIKPFKPNKPIKPSRVGRAPKNEVVYIQQQQGEFAPSTVFSKFQADLSCPYTPIQQKCRRSSSNQRYQVFSYDNAYTSNSSAFANEYEELHRDHKFEEFERESKLHYLEVKEKVEMLKSANQQRRNAVFRNVSNYNIE